MAPYNRKHIHENSGKAGAMARGGGAFSDEEIQLLRGLPAVANVTRNRITYADSFKQVCTIRYLTGESPTKIFREAGLPPDLIGYKRIERCVDRWKTSAIKSVTGSGNMSDSEIIAQLVNRYEHAFVMRRNLDSITNRTMEHIPVKAQGDDGIDVGTASIIIKQQARRIDELERANAELGKSPPPPDPDHRYAIRKRESSGQPRESAIYRRDRAAGGYGEAKIRE